MTTTRGTTALGALLLAASLWTPGATQAAIVYDTVINTGAVANPNVGSFTNCLAAEGCLGKDGLVDVAGGNLPAVIPYVFTFTAEEIAAINAGPVTSGTFTVVASRDIGHKAGAAADDVIGVSADGIALGGLFANTIDTCPAGERGVAYSADLVCGPNFHTDVTAADFLTLSMANLVTFAADGSVQFILDPTDAVGRLKIFSVELQIMTAPIPEPASAALLALGLAGIGLLRRRRTR